MDQWTNNPDSAATGWSAPTLVALSTAGSALGGVVKGLTENATVKYTIPNRPSYDVRFGYAQPS
jgi:hypothetical protein